MQIIYPSDDFNNKIIDESYLEESILAKANGFNIGILDITKFKEDYSGLSKVDKNELSIWRGWMFKDYQYKKLEEQCNLLISTEEYISSHYIVNWYDKVSQYTPKSIFIKEGDEININENRYFVKDYVKSNTGKLGSIANNLKEVMEIIKELKKYRGDIEGGICLRDVVDLKEETEQRLFVVNGKVFSNDNIYPDYINDVVSILNPKKFYSLDIVDTKENKNIIIEIGDAQVSDIKKWNLNNFIKVLLAVKNIDYKNIKTNKIR